LCTVPSLFSFHVPATPLIPCLSLHDALPISSFRGLTHLRDGKSYLEAGFALRCFQRLSIPHIATQRCSWRNNWYTSGASIPVLSDRKSTRLNSSHVSISYAVFCLKKQILRMC